VLLPWPSGPDRQPKERRPGRLLLNAILGSELVIVGHRPEQRWSLSATPRSRGPRRPLPAGRLTARQVTSFGIGPPWPLPTARWSTCDRDPGGCEWGSTSGSIPAKCSPRWNGDSARGPGHATCWTARRRGAAVRWGWLLAWSTSGNSFTHGIAWLYRYSLPRPRSSCPRWSIPRAGRPRFCR